MLVIRLSSLGDVVLATGAVALIQERRPDLAIDVLTRAAYAPVWQGQRAVRRLLIADDPAQPRPPAGAPRYGHVLDLQGGTKGRRAALQWAPGAGRTAYPRAALARRRLVLCGLRAPAVEPLVVRFGRAICGAALPAARLAPAVTADPARVAAVRAELSAGGRPARGWALLAPGASRPLKAIPGDLCSQIEAQLRARGWGTVRLEAPAASGWAAEGDAGRIFRGELPEVIALLGAVDAVVASDSGVLHLATALAKPTVALFGPTVPELGFAPLGCSRALGVELACRPCHVHGPAFCWLGHRRCWRDLSAFAVVAALEELAAAGWRP